VRVVCQRVTEARVRVGSELHAEIGPGLVALVGIARGDDSATVRRLAAKVARLRVFEDENGRFDRNVLETGGSVLSISQFTLIADSRSQRGTRPDFSGAAPREQAEPLYEEFCQALRDLGVPVETGLFGARMLVELVNEGPVTIILDS
jgi:D-tyrosyl-tRNA(Tyr) deacylase